ncbi:MAG: molybdopterin-binding protein [Burkholderiaceae bacterium]|jgi:molybdopterin-binding protein
MRISARNTIEGVITHIEPGAVNSEVTIKTTGGLEVVSIITKHSVENLGLKVGGKAYAVIKSSDVLIAVD